MSTNEKWLDELASAVRENPALLRDARSCGTMLRDLLPGDGNRAKVNALRMALDEAVPKLLEDDRSGGEKWEHSMARRTRNLSDATGLDGEIAGWSVWVWGVVIGAVERSADGAATGPARSAPESSAPSSTSVPLRREVFIESMIADPSLAPSGGEYTNPKDGSVFVLVPAGEFEMGDGKKSDCPKHRVYLDAYYIGKYCVTNAQYSKFVIEAGNRPPNNDFWNRPKEAKHPVTNVSWDDATAYAKWAGCDLPTEAQWEKAARGPDGYFYPWGNEWEPSKLRHSDSKGIGSTAPVDGYPDGVSGYGTYQQAGNVWEWCSDWYDENYYKSPEALRNPRGPASGSRRVYRGGSWWFFNPLHFRGAYRGRHDPAIHFNYLGFRLVRTP